MGVPIVNKDSGWQEVYALTGYAKGSAVLIQNQSKNPLRSQRVEKKPAANDFSGYKTPTEEDLETLAGDKPLWVRCVGGLNIYVQENR